MVAPATRKTGFHFFARRSNALRALSDKNVVASQENGTTEPQKQSLRTANTAIVRQIQQLTTQLSLTPGPVAGPGGADN